MMLKQLEKPLRRLRSVPGVGKSKRYLSYLLKIKRVPFWVWYSKHELTHVLMGLIYAWVLRELWDEFSIRYITLAVLGSVVIDLDHVIYFFLYGRHESYAAEVRNFIKKGQLGTLVKFLRDNHKHNTSLATHNVFVLSFFTLISFFAAYYDWKASIVFFGAIVIHLLYDIVDDFWVMGHMNDNWKRIGRKR